MQLYHRVLRRCARALIAFANYTLICVVMGSLPFIPRLVHDFLLNGS